MDTIRLFFTSRYLAFTAVTLLSAVFAALAVLNVWFLLPFAVAALLSLRGVYDVTQRSHSILRNYPLLAHIRFILEKIRPEIRQYFLESETDGTPFSRNKRSIVYQRAKGALDKRPFGTQLDVYAENFEWIHHSMAPTKPATEPFRIPIGGKECTKPYSASILNIS